MSTIALPPEIWAHASTWLRDEDWRNLRHVSRGIARAMRSNCRVSVCQYVKANRARQTDREMAIALRAEPCIRIGTAVPDFLKDWLFATARKVAKEQLGPLATRDLRVRDAHPRSPRPGQFASSVIQVIAARLAKQPHRIHSLSVDCDAAKNDALAISVLVEACASTLRYLTLPRMGLLIPGDTKKARTTGLCSPLWLEQLHIREFSWWTEQLRVDDGIDIYARILFLPRIPELPTLRLTTTEDIVDGAFPSPSYIVAGTALPVTLRRGETGGWSTMCADAVDVEDGAKYAEAGVDTSALDISVTLDWQRLLEPASWPFPCRSLTVYLTAPANLLPDDWPSYCIGILDRVQFWNRNTVYRHRQYAGFGWDLITYSVKYTPAGVVPEVDGFTARAAQALIDPDARKALAAEVELEVVSEEHLEAQLESEEEATIISIADMRAYIRSLRGSMSAAEMMQPMTGLRYEDCAPNRAMAHVNT